MKAKFTVYSRVVVSYVTGGNVFQNISETNLQMTVAKDILLTKA